MRQFTFACAVCGKALLAWPPLRRVATQVVRPHGIAGRGHVDAVAELPELAFGAPEAAHAEHRLLQDLVAAAINEAVDRSHELASKRLGALTGGLKIPGLM